MVVPLVPECAQSFPSCGIAVSKCISITCSVVPVVVAFDSGVLRCWLSKKISATYVFEEGVDGAVKLVLQQHSLVFKATDDLQAEGTITIWVVAVVMWW
jgi:hypothetical protein